MITAAAMSYDLVGDIHGCDRSLEKLLGRLGYIQADGVYRHPQRRVIFVGDFIDRGPGQREVIGIVRPMIESGAALSVMGNHEFNAIAWFTRHPHSDGFLRRHTARNRRQHEAFLQVYERHQGEYADVIDWFRTLPLWLDLGDLRVVHACWEIRWIDRIKQDQCGSALLGRSLLERSTGSENWQYEAIETLLKGKEIPLRDGLSFNDKDGNSRRDIRVRWWDDRATTYQQAFLGPESARTHIPHDTIEGDHLVVYGHDQPPVFLGHYWMEGNPTPLATNIACLDYSVAKPGGKLVAYRWDGEQFIDPAKYLWVSRVEPDR